MDEIVTVVTAPVPRYPDGSEAAAVSVNSWVLDNSELILRTAPGNSPQGKSTRTEDGDVQVNPVPPPAAPNELKVTEPASVRRMVVPTGSPVVGPGTILRTGGLPGWSGQAPRIR